MLELRQFDFSTRHKISKSVNSTFLLMVAFYTLGRLVYLEIAAPSVNKLFLKDSNYLLSMISLGGKNPVTASCCFLERM